MSKRDLIELASMRGLSVGEFVHYHPVEIHRGSKKLLLALMALSEGLLFILCPPEVSQTVLENSLDALTGDLPASRDRLFVISHESGVSLSRLTRILPRQIFHESEIARVSMCKKLRRATDEEREDLLRSISVSSLPRLLLTDFSCRLHGFHLGDMVIGDSCPRIVRS